MIREMQLNNSLFGNIANFIKKRLIEFFGLVLITFFFFFIFALFNYSAENSTLIYKGNDFAKPGVFYHYSNITADFFLQSFGLISFLIGISVLSWGINLVITKKVTNILSRFLYTVIYILSGCLFVYTNYNNSFWLIDNGNSGFIGEKSFNFIYNFLPLVENNFFRFVF